MKLNSTALLIALNLSLLRVTYGQGLFQFKNLGFGVDAPVFDAQGNPLAGSLFSAELWGGAAPDSLAPAGTIGAPTRFIVPFRDDGGAGYFLGPSVFILAIPPGGWAWLQVRAWDNRLGGTYEEVAALGLGGYGESPLFYEQGANPFDYNSIATPLTGLQSFSLLPEVPEPSAWALLLGGGVGWAILRRRRARATPATSATFGPSGPLGSHRRD